MASAFNPGTFTKVAAGAAVLAGSAGIAWWTHSSPGPTNTVAPNADVFVADASAGSGDGSSCANPKAYTFFNDANQWGSGKTIDAGKTVGLCGTITHDLSVRGSGTAGHPITILFEPGAKISEPLVGVSGSPFAAIWMGGTFSYVTINGGTNGVIENTANGTGLANHTNNTMAVYLESCDHCIVENLTIRNLYVRTSTADENIGAIQQYAVEEYKGTNDLFTHLTINNSEVGIYTRTDAGATTLTNDEISYVTFANVDHNIALSTAGTTGAIGPVLIHNNNFDTSATWDDTVGNAYHHSFIHCYSSDTVNPAHYLGLYVYDNVGTLEANTQFNTGGYFIESTATTTPCDDSTSHNYVFNNVVFDQNGTNAAIQIGAGIDSVYNNTVIGPTTSGVTATAFTTFQGPTLPPTVTSENNVFTTEAVLAYTNVTTYTADYNIYANGGSSPAFYQQTVGCNNTYAFSAFASWQTCISGDAHSSTTADAKLGSDGVPQAGSPVIAAGTNLTSLCTGLLVPLCSTITGVARPAVGAWNAGAY